MNTGNKLKEDEFTRTGFAEAENITKKFAKTFYFASLFLSGEKRRASYSVYAICRISDESVDGICHNDRNLIEVKEDINAAYGNTGLKKPLLCAFRHTINAYEIPKRYFDELIEGMQMDLNKNRYLNFEELYEYCYKVAGVVGLIMLKIFGYKDRKAEQCAVDLGVAMQLTNILRDIREDYSRGRIYLPLDEMGRFGVKENDVSGKEINNDFIDLIRFQIERAREYYKNSGAGIKFIRDIKSRFVVCVMKDMYCAILNRIERNGYDVFSKRAYVSFSGKLIICLKTLIKGQFI